MITRLLEALCAIERTSKGALLGCVLRNERYEYEISFNNRWSFPVLRWEVLYKTHSKLVDLLLARLDAASGVGDVEDRGVQPFSLVQGL